MAIEVNKIPDAMNPTSDNDSDNDEVYTHKLKACTSMKRKHDNNWNSPAECSKTHNLEEYEVENTTASLTLSDDQCARTTPRQKRSTPIKNESDAEKPSTSTSGFSKQRNNASASETLYTEPKVDKIPFVGLVDLSLFRPLSTNRVNRQSVIIHPKKCTSKLETITTKISLTHLKTLNSCAFESIRLEGMQKPEEKDRMDHTSDYSKDDHY